MQCEWNEWCRLCAKENGAQVDVFGENLGHLSAREAIEKFLSITILPYDEVPKMICYDCFNYIKDIVQFSEQCLRVKSIFINILTDKANGKLYAESQTLRCKYGLELSSDTPKRINKMYDKATETNDVVAEYLQMNDNIDDHLLTILVTKTEPEEDAGESVASEKSDLSSDLHQEGFALNENDVSKLDFEEIEDGSVNADEENPKCEDDCDPTYVQPILAAEESEADQEADENFSPETEEDMQKVQQKVVARSKTRPVRSRRARTNRNFEENSQIYECNDCEKVFLDRAQFRRHAQTHNTSDTKFNCSKCSKSFQTQKSLHLHEAVHLPPEMKMLHPCAFCDKKFTKSANVQAHIRAIHTGEKPFICEECGKSFSTRGALKEHKYTHIDDTPYECAHCPKKFKNMARLKTHEDIHNNTTYVCPNCGLQLNTKRTLKMHMVVHSDQKKYKCHFCGNEYKRSKALKNHLILHTGLRPYMCPFCDKTFANGSNCRSHKKKAHPDELAAMEAAGEAPPATNIPKLAQLKAQPHNITIQPVHSKMHHPEGSSIHQQSHSDFNVYSPQMCSPDFSDHHHAVMSPENVVNDHAKGSDNLITHDFHTHSILGAL